MCVRDVSLLPLQSCWAHYAACADLGLWWGQMVSPALSLAAATEVLVKGLYLTRTPHFKLPLEMQEICVEAVKVLEGVDAVPRDRLGDIVLWRQDREGFMAVGP